MTSNPAGQSADRPSDDQLVWSQPVFGLAGWHNAGKTTLLERLIGELRRRNHTVSTIKHAHHQFDVDQPGKDSYRHREAGAEEVLIASEHRWALMNELRGTPEPTLADLVARLSAVDIVLVEGFKRTPIPKLEIYRTGQNGNVPLAINDPTIVAVATDDAQALPAIPRPEIIMLMLQDIEAIADCVLAHCQPIGSVSAEIKSAEP